MDSAAASIATRWTRSSSSSSRPPGKPFLLLIAGPDMIERLDLAPARRYAANLVARHWPGPLTLVLPGGERRVPDRLRGPEGGVAVRWTSHPARHAADSRPRRRHHLDERQPSGGSASHVRRRDSFTMGRRCGSRAVARARRRNAHSVATVHGPRLHWAASASHSAGRDSRRDTCARACPT